jgi:hypothetical protein
MIDSDIDRGKLVEVCRVCQSADIYPNRGWPVSIRFVSKNNHVKRVLPYRLPINAVEEAVLLDIIA